MIGESDIISYGDAASELPRGEVGFLSADEWLHIPNWAVVPAEGAEVATAGDAGLPKGEVEYSRGTIELPDPIAGTEKIAEVIGGRTHCDACGDPGGFVVEEPEELGVCEQPEVAIDDSWLTRPGEYACCGQEGGPEWLTVEIVGAVMPGTRESLVDAQVEMAREVYSQCCVQVEVAALERWDDDAATEVLGNNLYLDEDNILQDQFGFFHLSGEQHGLLEAGSTPGEPIPVWWARRTRQSEVGYVMRADGIDERTVVLSGNLTPGHDANDIVLAHELGHVLLEGSLEGDHHDYMHRENLMASGRINSGRGALTAEQCGWIRSSAYME
jgi:hypothetical protein